MALRSLSHKSHLLAKSAPHDAREAEDVPLFVAKPHLPHWRQIEMMRQGVLAAFSVREPVGYMRDLKI